MKKLQKWLPGFLIFAVLLVSMLGGAAFGKYIYSEKLGGKVTITANLGSIDIWESEANRKDDGSYSLDQSNPVKSNSYDLLPGLDIPKDPYVAVDKASAIPVYVFVEVCTNLTNDAITFDIDAANWSLLEKNGNPIKGKNDGKVYVYIVDGQAAQVTDDIEKINILAGRTVYIGQELLHDTLTAQNLIFYASMGQVVSGQSPEMIYDSLIQKVL